MAFSLQDESRTGCFSIFTKMTDITCVSSNVSHVAVGVYAFVEPGHQNVQNNGTTTFDPSFLQYGTNMDGIKIPTAELNRCSTGARRFQAKYIFEDNKPITLQVHQIKS